MANDAATTNCWTKRSLLYTATAGFVLSTVLATHGFVERAAAVVDSSPDCDNVAIIKCGAFTKKGLLSKYDANVYGDIPAVFDAFGISRADIASGSFVEGVVWRDGRVTVNGKTVATDAMTAGRNYGGTPIAGSKNAGKYPTSKFVTEGQVAFVKMSGNRFLFAILKTCGNPVSGKKIGTNPPAPQPKYSCDSLTKNKISRSEYDFTAKASASNGASITSYKFDFGDGNLRSTNSPNVQHNYKKPGSYTVRATAVVKVGDKTINVSGPDCLTTVTVDKVPVTPPTPKPPVEKIKVCEIKTSSIITVNKNDFNPKLHSNDLSDCRDNPVVLGTTTQSQQPQVSEPAVSSEAPPKEIPATGPEVFAGGLVGSGAIGYGAYSFASSRRNLMQKLLSRR